MTRVPVRDDLRALEGYHSPQVDVRVRLNTNESPGEPPAAWRDAFAAELSRVAWHRYPDRAADRTARRDRRRCTASPPSRSSPPTARTRCCRRCCSPTPARAAPSPRSSRRTSCTRTSPGSPAPRWSEGERAADFTLDLDGGARGDRARPAHRHVPVLAEQPDRPGRAGRATCARCSTRWRCCPSRAARRRRGLRPVRRLVGARPRSTRTCRSSSPARSPRRGRWPAPASATSSARRGSSPSSTRWCCRTTSTRPSRSPAASRCASSTRWTSGSRRSSPSASASSARFDDLPVDLWPSGANFVLFRPRTDAGAARSGRGCSTAASSCATAAAWPRLDDCLRVTIGTPEENDALPHRPPARSCHERRTRPPAARRRRPRRPRSSCTLDLDGTGEAHDVDRHPVLRPHARPARPHGGFDLTVQATGDLHIDTPPHRRGRRRSRSARRSARRSATRSACVGSRAAATRSTRRSSRSRSTCRVARSSCTRCALPECLPLGNPPFDPQLAEHVVSSFATAAGITLHVVARARPQHAPHHRGDVQGPRPLPARRGAGRGHGRCRRTKGVL